MSYLNKVISKTGINSTYVFEKTGLLAHYPTEMDEVQVMVIFSVP